MLDFFIALFGGIYYGGKYLKDKAEVEAIDRRNTALISDTRADYDRFISKMTDKTLEREVRKELYSEKYKGYIDNVIKEVLDEARARGYELPNERDDTFRMIHLFPKHRILIAMASLGKLPYDVASFGIYRPPLHREHWEAHALFMDWLDKELQSHGVEPMVFQSELQPKMWQTGVKVLAKDAQMCCGHFGWWSNRLWL